MHSFNLKKSISGFSMFEIIVSMALFVIIIMLTGSMFTISQRAYNAGANQGELTQNVRVVLDRMSREIRQSQNIITDLSSTSTQLFFQDGHNPAEITYIRYFLNGTDLMRTHEAYYFLSFPNVHVAWDSIDGFNNTTTKEILDSNDNIVGEYFNKLQFWGDNSLVHIIMELTKNQKTTHIESSVFSRNY